MSKGELIELKRECEAIEIPSGIRRHLPAGTVVSISQFLGSGYTVVSDLGYMCRIDAKDADALGLSSPGGGNEDSHQATFSEALVWDQLKTVYDPEIPVNIVDLGLIYSCEITALENGGRKVDVKMSMTAPGCGMGNVLKADVESKLARLPEVKEVNVQVVFDPPWHPGRMSEAAKLQLGFDLDLGTPLARISR
jgi:probable FeS assembly SUF system protein SufT